MAPSLRDLQLTASGGGRRRKQAAIDEESGDLEDVRLLDDYEDGKSAKLEGFEEGTKRIQVAVTGMTCAACSNSVEGALRSVHGVLRASVALLQNKADVVFDPNLVKEEDIKIAIEDAGFEAEVIPEPSISRTKPHGTLVGQFTIGGMTCAACVNSVEGILRDLPEGKRAIVALATSLGEVEYDPTVITGRALLYGAVTGFWSPTYFETSAMLITFVLLGKYVETLAKGKTSDAIKKLVELTPATALVLVQDKGGKNIEEKEIDALLIQPGDNLKVLPSTKVPVDGVVMWGSSYINESMVTGESTPVSKEVNSSVIGGTMNLHGSLHIQATKVGSDTVLSQIISLVETAQMSKAPIQKFADFIVKLLVDNAPSITNEQNSEGSTALGIAFDIALNSARNPDPKHDLQRNC